MQKLGSVKSLSRIKPSIIRKAILVALLPTLIISIIIGTYISYSKYQDFRALLKEQTHHFAEAISSKTEYFLITGRKQALYDFLKKSATETKLPVENIAIYDKEFKLYFALSYSNQLFNLEKSSLTESNIAHWNDSTLTSTSAIIPYQIPHANDVVSRSFIRSPLGYLRITLDADAIYSGYLLETIVIILSLVAGVLISSVFLLRLIKVNNRILRMLTEKIEKIGQGNSDEAIEKQAVPIEFERLQEGILLTGQTVSEAKELLELKVNSTTRELRHNLKLLEEKNQELEEAKHAAMKASNIKSDFLATMSHEIRTPLNAVVGFSRELAKSQLPEPHNKYAESLFQSSQDLMSLVSDILEMSKIEAGEMEFKYSQFALTELVEGVSRIVAPIAHEKGIEFIINEGRSDLVIESDQYRLKQVLINLINNAIKFTDDGYVSLSIEAKIVDESADLQIVVKDTGMGLSTNQQEMLFTSLGNASSDPSRQYGGSGLGLSISKTIIEKLGGSVSLKSIEGLGAEFIIQLPNSIKDISYIRTAGAVPEKIMFFETNIEAAHALFESCACLQTALTICRSIKELRQSLQHNINPDILIISQSVDKRGVLPPVKDIVDICRQEIGFAGKVVLFTPWDKLNQQIDALPELTVLPKPITREKIVNAVAELNALPAATANSIPAVNVVSSVSPVARFKVLAVDDNETNLQLLSLVMRTYPIELVTVTSGKQACVLADQQQFDLIITDVQMPEMGGVEVASNIKLGKLNRTTPIVAFTAFAFNEEKQSLLEQGMDDYLTKPLDEQKLAQLLAKWCFKSPKLSLVVN
ncbi:response regulator [Flocculibacter collagenilyticus]|uniref:response regulator n=1 Tax=Flocculibacter collagenilyticus TaxID=2744479 RepID=UPI0018F4D7D6|nr:response regulator [Flocculibacter collagenilyticus]